MLPGCEGRHSTTRTRESKEEESIGVVFSGFRDFL
jgi:hypothetical protein